jgi:hypothetical protein
MLAFLLGLFRLIWLFGKGHHAVVLENLALRQQLAIYKRKQMRPRLVGRDRWFWIALSVVWTDWRRALRVVHPDTVVRWQRERFRRFWANLSKSSVARVGRPPVSLQVRTLIRTLAQANPLWRAPRIQHERSAWGEVPDDALGANSNRPCARLFQTWTRILLGIPSPESKNSETSQVVFSS